MLRPLRKKGVGGSFFLVLCIFIVFPGVAFAAHEIIYKPAHAPKQVLSKQKKETKKEVAAEEEEQYIYDPTGKTDPFKSFLAKQEELEEKKRRKPKTYLETLELSQLQLIAIITGPKGNFAMVRDSKGTGHVIKKGTAIGTNGGVVDKITDKEVIIKEEYRDFRGNKKFKIIKKKLPSPVM